MENLGIPAPSGSPRPTARVAGLASRHRPLLVLLFVSAALRGVFFILAEDMTSMRLALNAAAASSYGLLGISEWAIDLPAFVASLLTLFVVYAIARLIGGRASRPW